MLRRKSWPWEQVRSVNKMADYDGFQVVKRSKGHKNKKYKDKNESTTKFWNKSTSYDSVKCDANELRTKIEKCRHEKVYFFLDDNFVFF